MIYDLKNQKDMNDAAFKTGTKKIKWETFINAFTLACRKKSKAAKTVEDYLIPIFDLDEARAHYSRGYNNPPQLIEIQTY